MACRIGPVDFVVPVGDLERTAMDMVGLLECKIQKALCAAKNTIDRAIEQGLEAGLQYEVEPRDELFEPHDQEEGRRAFLEKRKPKFSDPRAHPSVRRGWRDLSLRGGVETSAGPLRTEPKGLRTPVDI